VFYLCFLKIYRQRLTGGLALLGHDVVIFIFSNMAAVVRAGQTPMSILSYLVLQQRISSGSGRTFFKSPNNAKPCPSDCEKTP
jgi:hypothetical protein